MLKLTVARLKRIECAYRSSFRTFVNICLSKIRWGGEEGAKRDDRGAAGYTLNCSVEIDGVSPLPLEHFVCPTCATRARMRVYVHTWDAYVYVQRRQGKYRKSDVSEWLKMIVA